MTRVSTRTETEVTSAFRIDGKDSVSVISVKREEDGSGILPRATENVSAGPDRSV